MGALDNDDMSKILDDVLELVQGGQRSGEPYPGCTKAHFIEIRPFLSENSAWACAAIRNLEQLRLKLNYPKNLV